MAFPQVVTTSQGTGGAQSVSVSLPSGIATGDLLLCVFIKDAGDPVTSITGSGWADLANSGTVTVVWGAVYWKIADGSDSLTINYATQNEQVAYACYRIGSWHGTTPPEVALANSASNDASPDPPNLAPSWGSEDTLWIAAYGWDDGSKTHSAYPTNYSSNQVSEISAGTAGCGVAISTRELAASSDNPGVGTLSASETWRAFTIAVRPAGGGATTGALPIVGRGPGMALAGNGGGLAGNTGAAA